MSVYLWVLEMKKQKKDGGPFWSSKMPLSWLVTFYKRLWWLPVGQRTACEVRIRRWRLNYYQALPHFFHGMISYYSLYSHGLHRPGPGLLISLTFHFTNPTCPVSLCVPAMTLSLPGMTPLFQNLLGLWLLKIAFVSSICKLESNKWE